MLYMGKNIHEDWHWFNFAPGNGWGRVELLIERFVQNCSHDVHWSQYAHFLTVKENRTISIGNMTSNNIYAWLYVYLFNKCNKHVK
jgi:hypothetical protein